MARNVSLFALPIYWLLVMATRGYSVAHVKRHARTSLSAPSSASGTTPSSKPDEIVDNASPHSSATVDRVRASLSPAAFATWERIEAAHRNGLENMALFFSAVIVANIARVNALEVSLIAWLYVASRLLYVILYIRISTLTASYTRSATFGVGVLLCWYLLLRGAVFVLYDYDGRD